MNAKTATHLCKDGSNSFSDLNEDIPPPSTPTYPHTKHTTHTFCSRTLHPSRISFSDLNEDIPPPSAGKTEFFPCMMDADFTIALGKTLDPLLAAKVQNLESVDFPRVSGLVVRG